MSKYIDIHSHILPGIDDGATTLEQTVAMLRIAAENNIGTIICTPHYKNDRYQVQPEKVNDLVAKVNAAAHKEDIPVKLYAGNELYYFNEMADFLENKDVLSLADSLFVLVEFAPDEYYSYLRDGICRILDEGYRPVLAHAERYKCLRSSKEKTTELKRMGMLLQINADSIMGNHSRDEKKFIKYLLKEHMVDFIATDAHSDKRRGPYLADCAAYIKKKYGEQYACKLLWENAQDFILPELKNS